MSNYHLIQHPLFQAKLGKLRNKNTPPAIFRNLLRQMSQILFYEATKEIQLNDIRVQTPMGETKAVELRNNILAIAILRAGIGMVDGIQDLAPEVQVGHLGIYRDKFIGNTVEYYFKAPKDIQDKEIFLCDPLIATGDTILASLQRLSDYGASRIKILTFCTGPGVEERIFEHFPECHIFAASKEEECDEKGYLKPGIGDAGDRLYGTL